MHKSRIKRSGDETGHGNRKYRNFTKADAEYRKKKEETQLAELLLECPLNLGAKSLHRSDTLGQPAMVITTEFPCSLAP